MRLFSRLMVILALAVTSSGCAFFYKDRIHYIWEEGRSAAPEPAVASSDYFLGIALSGGGSRAAVFGAAGMEALTEAGLMQAATHVSSVSGGGLANAYHLVHGPADCAAGDAGAACREAYFARMYDALQHNYLRDVVFRQLGKPNRFGSPTRRLSSLEDALDAQIVGGASFGDLPPRPVAFFNGARFDDARRFVFTNARMAEGPGAYAPFTEMGIRSATFSLEGCQKATPPDFPVALAVAISAGFPPLLGPGTLHMPNDCGGPNEAFWHLGDGGILDNSGVETLEDFALDHVANGEPYRDIFIIAFDAGRSTPTEDMMATRSLDLWTTDPGRVVDIVGKRARAYRELVTRDLSTELGVPYSVVHLRYTDARLTEWPAACGRRTGGAAAILEELKVIPTSFKISDCHAALMREAAHKLVREMLDEHGGRLRALGGP